MQIYTLQEFQEDFDNLINRVENGESFMITSEHGNAVMVPYNTYEEAYENIRFFVDHDDAC